MSPNPLIFALLLFVSLVVFCAGCYRRFSLIAIGQGENRTDNIAARLQQLFEHAFAQQRVIAKPAGVNHAIIFWSFIVLLLANGEFLLKGLVPSISLALLPEGIHGALLFAFDLVSLLALAAVIFAAARRLFFPPESMSSAYVKARSLEGFLILGFIAILMLAYFGLHAAEIALGQETAAAWMPVSSFVARAFAAFPFALSPSPFALFCWWLHAGALLAFLCFLPQSKHMHILTAIPNIFFGSLTKLNCQPREEFAPGNRYGAATVDQFSWKDLLDGFSCTECGRCQSACPAAATGKSLNPRQVIHAIKTNLIANGAALKKGQAATVPLVGAEAEGTTTAETIWGCTTCGACMQSCPVLIEHMPKIITMRRHLVQMESSFPEELLNLFENLEGRSNPWGIAPSERTKWHATTSVRTFEAGTTEYLFFIGCAGAFDSRQKHATVAMATILDAAGISWGILGREELCCGDSARRLGNEYLFEKMATENVALLQQKGVKKIITQCPHCFTTLKNDYRQYGLELEVIHHAELLPQLISSGRLTLNGQVTELGKMLFHDSCYLGRHNDLYDGPREAIRLATGTAPAEFGRNGRESFCCGAGGGRMWQEETQGERINISRVKEALAQQPDTICVSCPYCMTMMEDGLKDLQAGATRVKDLAEVVAEGLRPAAALR